jgi:hypothetical protein
MFKKRMADNKPRMILKFPLLLRNKTNEIGKIREEKMAKEFGVPIGLKEEFLAKSKGKIKML